MGPLGTNFNEILIEIRTFSFKKMHLKMSSGRWRLFCLSMNELKNGQSFLEGGALDVHWQYFSLVFVIFPVITGELITAVQIR